MRHILILFIAGLLGLASCKKDHKTTTTTTPTPTPVTKNSLVVTVWNRSADTYYLYTYDTTGANPVLLINRGFPNNSNYAAPSISDNGKKVVYTSNDSLFIYDIAGATSTFIYKHANNSFNTPVLNPDGSKIAFIATEPSLSYRSNLYMIDATPGATPVNITNTPWAYWIGGGEFSRDGLKITYTIGYNADNAVYISNINGSNSLRVSEAHGFGNSDNYPVFTLDNSKVIYMSSRYTGYHGPFDLVISDAAEGSETSCTRLTTGTGFGVDYCAFPNVSKNGLSLYFIGVNTTANGPYNLYKMPLAGGAPVALTSNIDVNLLFCGIKEVKF